MMGDPARAGLPGLVMGVPPRAGLPGLEGVVMGVPPRAGLPGVEGAEPKTLERLDWLSRSRLSFSRLYFFRLAASFTTGGWRGGLVAVV